MAMLAALKGWAKALKREIILLWLAARDPRVPARAKWAAAFVAGYALSPIDLIPDFIPVLGLVDDLLLVPAGIWLVLRMIPADVRDELRSLAAQTPWPAPAKGAAAAIIACWAVIAALTVWYLWRR